MPTTSVYPNWLRAFVALVSLAIVLGLLHWAQAVLIPVVLAILLTFALSPIVTWFQHKGMGRVPAVMMVVVVVFTLLAGIGWLLAHQITSLVDTIPQYKENISQKITSWNTSGKGGFIEKTTRIADDITREIQKSTPKPKYRAGTKEPMPVIISGQDGPLGLSGVWPYLSPILEPFASVGLAIVLVIFMLIRREDLRDRVISLVGYRRMTLTTKALDEASERISRYLLMQLIINTSYGAAVALGLFLIGIPYALLWGFFSAVFRYVPYLGPWVAAILPLAVSLIVTESWGEPAMVFGLFLSLELLSNMIMEPMLYGRGIGVSETAALVMIAFWTWLWGPIGLVMATPLTVCLVVMGKYVPFLAFFDTLLGNKPALAPPMGFYQRLLARDQDEAAEIAEDYLKTHTLGQTYDELIIPSLSYAKRDLENNNLTEDDQQFILGASRDLVEQIAVLQQATVTETTDGTVDGDHVPIEKVSVLGCPARNETDESALLMFKELLDPRHCDLTLITAEKLTSEVVALVEEKKPALICIAALPPGGMAHTRLLCIRLMARFPDLKILVGRWGLTENLEKNREQLLSAGVYEVGMTLEETRNQVMTLVQVLAAPRT